MRREEKFVPTTERNRSLPVCEPRENDGLIWYRERMKIGQAYPSLFVGVKLWAIKRKDDSIEFYAEAKT